MQGLEGREPFEHLEHAEHASQGGGFVKRAAVLVAILAALLAIATLRANSAAEETLLKQGQANDAYNEFQGNSLKKHISDSEAAMLRTLSVGTPNEAAARAAADRVEKEVRQKYEPNKTALLTKAVDLEHERDTSASLHHRLQLAEGAFQIGIVLTSVALLSGTLLLVFSGGALGVVGLVLLVLGFLG